MAITDVLKQLGMTLAGAGATGVQQGIEGLGAITNPLAYQQQQENLRQRQQLQQQLQLHQMMTPYERESLNLQMQNHADMLKQQQLQDQLNVSKAVSEGYLQEVFPGQSQTIQMPQDVTRQLNLGGEGGAPPTTFGGSIQGLLPPTTTIPPFQGTPGLTYGGKSYDPVPYTSPTAKGIVVPPESPLGKEYPEIAGNPLSADQYATLTGKLQDKQQKIAETAANQALVEQYLNTYKNEINQRWAGSKDPNASRYRDMQIQQLETSALEDKRKGSTTQVTQAMKDAREWQSPFEKEAAKDAEATRQKGIALTNARALRGDTEKFQDYESTLKRIDAREKPLSDQSSALSTASTNLNLKTAAGDAAAAPALLRLAAPGGGYRMNEAEIKRIFGSQNKWEEFGANISKWSLDPSKTHLIGDTYRAQLNQMLGLMQDKLMRKQRAVWKSRADLDVNDSISKHKRVYSDLDRTINDIEGEGGVSVQGQLGLRPALPPLPTLPKE